MNNLVFRADRKIFKKAMHCSEKMLVKGAESCAELGIIIALSTPLLALYVKKIFRDEEKSIHKYESEIEVLLKLQHRV